MNVLDLVCARETERELQGAIVQASTRCQFLIVFLLSEGVSREEVGEMLGISESCVSSQVSNVRLRVMRLRAMQAEVRRGARAKCAKSAESCFVEETRNSW